VYREKPSAGTGAALENSELCGETGFSIPSDRLVDKEI
jgi:hypothetical protein